MPRVSGVHRQKNLSSVREKSQSALLQPLVRQFFTTSRTRTEPPGTLKRVCRSPLFLLMSLASSVLSNSWNRIFANF